MGFKPIDEFTLTKTEVLKAVLTIQNYMASNYLKLNVETKERKGRRRIEKAEKWANKEIYARRRKKWGQTEKPDKSAGRKVETWGEEGRLKNLFSQ